MKKLTLLFTLILALISSNAHATASIVPAFGTMSSATGGWTSAGKQGTNTLNITATGGASITVTKSPKPTVNFYAPPAFSLSPTLCSAGSAGTGIDTVGAIQGCTVYVTPGDVQSRKYDFGVDTGTANNYAVYISPVPLLYSGTPGPTGTFQALHTNTGASTLSIDGLPGIPIVRAVGGSIQALTGGEIVAGQIVQVAYDGINLQMQTPSAATATGSTSNTAIQGSYANLKTSATGTSATVTVTFDEGVLESSTNVYQTLRAVSLSIAGTSTGANGLDTGTIAGSTWYSLWVIYNGTTASGLMSLSATAPTMPSGYTYKARVGWIRTDGTANKYPLSFTQYGRRVQYKVAAGSNVTGLPVMASGVQGNISTPTWVAVDVGAFVPPTTSSINLLLQSLPSGSGINAGAAPNNSYGPGSSSTNPPPLLVASSSAWGANMQGSLLLESSNIYYYSNSTEPLFCIGWEDNL